MGLGDVEQLAGTLQVRHAHQDLHRRLDGLTLGARQLGLVGRAQLQVGRGLTSGVGKELSGHADPAILYRDLVLLGQGREGLGAQADHRQGATEEFFRDDGAQAEDLVRLGQYQRRRPASRQQQLKEHGAAGAGTAAAGDGQDAPGQFQAVQGMVAIDHPTAGRIDATPETQAQGCPGQASPGMARDQTATADRCHR